MKTGFTTTILRSDLESPIEHFSVHKPMHVAAAYGYPDAHDLARVFKGEMPGYSYGRQGVRRRPRSNRRSKNGAGPAEAPWRSSSHAIR